MSAFRRRKSGWIGIGASESLFNKLQNREVVAELRKLSPKKLEKRAEKAEAAIEEGIRLFVEIGKKYSVPKEEILDGLMSRYGMRRQEAEARVNKY